MNPNENPTPIEIEVTPDRMGIAFLRDLADTLEADLDRDDPMVELPVGIPRSLRDEERLRGIADALDRVVHDGWPEPPFKVRRMSFRTLPGA